MGIKDTYIVAAGVSIEEAIYDIRYTHVLRVRYENMMLQCYFLIEINLVLFIRPCTMCKGLLNLSLRL